MVIYILAARLNRNMGNQRPVLMFRLAISFIVLSAGLNALFAHYGSTVLFTISPSLPVLGGAIMLEALIYGAINGLVLASIFGAFSLVSVALPARSIIRLLPRAFYPAAVVLSIALTFLPNTLHQFRQIREAQAVRGHRMRGIRDWLPLIMPLLIGGLERAFNLSESMTARGFSSLPEAQPAPGRQLIALSSLSALLAGWVMYLQGDYRTIGLLLMIAGGVLIVWLIWRSGRSAPVTTYRRELWKITDSLIILCTSVSWIAFLLPIAGTSTSTFPYNPYPVITVPGFNPWIGISILGLLGPLLGMPLSTPAARGENNPETSGPTLNET